jgi:two-component system, OmpR family, aerobic respiration control sensor histidine kinase ArcB
MKKMLIIEDDDLSIKVMRRIFQANFEVFVCESAEEYYEKYSNTDYNIILMDISLKGKKNGLELIKEIKETPSYKSTPIICLTAHAQTKIRQTAIDSGSDLFITKPVSNKILKEAVDFLLKSKKR